MNRHLSPEGANERPRAEAEAAHVPAVSPAAANEGLRRPSEARKA